MSSGSSSQPANTTQTITIRYAPYIEERHKNFLLATYDNRVDAIGQSPYAEIEDIEVEQAFFGAGYALSSFPPIYEMFGKYLSAIDLETLFNNTLENIVGSEVINNDVRKENALMMEKITKDFNDLGIGMRKINAINSSSFIVSKAIIEGRKLKALEQYSLIQHVSAITAAELKFINNLDAYRKMVTTNATMLKEYYMIKDHVDDRNTYVRSRDILWPFLVLDFEQCALGALTRAAQYQKTMGANRQRSTLSTVLSIASDTVTGATIGSQVGGGYGAIGGAVIGFKIGITRMLLERSEFGWIEAALVWGIF